MDMNDETALRVVALQSAVQSVDHSGGCRHDILERAQEFYTWVSQRTPARIRLTSVGEITQQKEQEPMQIKDSEQFDLTFEVDDAKAQPITGAAVTVTVDQPSVASVNPTADGTGYTIVGGVVGSAVITFDAGVDDAGNPIKYTEAVDVVPGSAATIKVTEGTPVPQASAPVNPPVA